MPGSLPRSNPDSPSFAEALERVDAAIRRERKPLPSPALEGVALRAWAAAVLPAEMDHAVEDSWRAIHALGASSFFDGLKRTAESRAFWFDHEWAAVTAHEALGALNLHDGDVKGGWSRSDRWPRNRWREWARERLALKQQFWRFLARYRALREPIDQAEPAAA
jgi:hypothetical protein